MFCPVVIVMHSLLSLAAQLCEYEPDLRPSAEDAFLWLEDLHNELDDEAGDADGAQLIDTLPKIEYEAMFVSPSGMTVDCTRDDHISCLSSLPACAWRRAMSFSYRPVTTQTSPYCVLGCCFASG